MLHQFVTANRDEIIARCRAKISSRPVPRPTDAELEHGVPLFLDQLAETLRQALEPTPVSSNDMVKSAGKHGTELLQRGFTIAQVVHDYGGVCQTITELALEKGAPITTAEFKTLNQCLDDSIAEAVSEYGRLRGREGTEREGQFVHELRNHLATAFLSWDMLKTGSVGPGGSTGAVLTRSLTGLRDLVDRQLAQVRLGGDVHHRERITVCEFIEDVEVAATLDANSRGLQFSVPTVPRNLSVYADRQILLSVVGNLLQNAFKFTHAGGQVVLRAHATDHRVLIDVEDQCGGLPPGTAEDLFRPFEQQSTDRTGLGLGLGIAERGARVNDGRVTVRNHPGTGCIFTVDLPRQ